MFDRQSMIVTTFPNANAVKEMNSYLYPGGLLFGTNIIIAKILFFLVFM